MGQIFVKHLLDNMFFLQRGKKGVKEDEEVCSRRQRWHMLEEEAWVLIDQPFPSAP